MVNVTELNERLAKGVVTFKFHKKDGSERIAIGTRSGQVSEDAGVTFSEPKGGDPNPYAFFDLEKGAWRSWSEAYNPDGVEILED